MNLWQILKVPQSPLNAILSSLWIRNKDSNYSAPRSYKTEFTSVAESVSSEMAAPIPIPIELGRNLMIEGGWPLMIDQWPILIPMNTNTNINTNTNDPNTNRAGEEFDQWRWMTIDQWPNLLGEKVTRERGKKMLTNLMSEKVATKRVNIDIVQEMLTNLMSEKVTRKRVNPTRLTPACSNSMLWWATRSD